MRAMSLEPQLTYFPTAKQGGRMCIGMRLCAQTYLHCGLRSPYSSCSFFFCFSLTCLRFAVCCFHLRWHKTLHTLWRCPLLAVCASVCVCDKCNNIINPTTATRHVRNLCLRFFLSHFERLRYVIKDLIFAAPTYSAYKSPHTLAHTHPLPLCLLCCGLALESLGCCLCLPVPALKCRLCRVN